MTFVIYLPSLFRYEVVRCVLYADDSITYYKRDNTEFLETMFYSVRNLIKIFCNFMIFNNSMQVYKVILEIVFKLAPTVLIASLNVKIMIVYRQTCNKVH